MSDGKERLKLQWMSADSLKPKISILAWQCPACGVGVRGDVEVCPNCVKNKTELATKEDSSGAGRPRVITEYPYLRSQGLVDEDGYLTDKAMKNYGIEE